MARVRVPCAGRITFPKFSARGIGQVVLLDSSRQRQALLRSPLLRARARRVMTTGSAATRPSASAAHQLNSGMSSVDEVAVAGGGGGARTARTHPDVLGDVKQLAIGEEAVLAHLKHAGEKQR
jgi:hypothetical protein